MSNKISKLENPIRLLELNPEETLKSVGFEEGMVLCDIGAGTGIFSVPAARISKNIIYALELSEEMIEIIENKKEKFVLSNLETKKVDSDILPLNDETCDFALLVTVFHEINQKEKMLKEIHRILKYNGKFIMIEFHKKETSMGPPMEYRISSEFVKEICESNGFKELETKSMGENLYLGRFVKM